MNCEVKEEAEEWKTVDRQRGKRRTSGIPSKYMNGNLRSRLLVIIEC